MIFQDIYSLYQFRVNKIHKFKAKVFVQAELGPFQIKSVTGGGELKQILRWRRQHSESSWRGTDEFDFSSDHLVLTERKSQKIIATFRLRRIHKPALGRPVHLKLSRACLGKVDRHGVILSLIWRGIANYMAATDAQVLFVPRTCRPILQWQGLMGNIDFLTILRREDLNGFLWKRFKPDFVASSDASYLSYC